MNSTPKQFSGEIPTNSPIYPTPEPVFNIYDENNNQDNLRKSRFMKIIMIIILINLLLNLITKIFQKVK